jgi:ADP-ribose pyrophosphatase YjhB (NUDIX family)
LIRRGQDILLVQQQGDDHPVPTWALPGGVVEVGELPTEAMIREVGEETGLEVLDPGRLLYLKSGVDVSGESVSTTFVFEIDQFCGELRPASADDPVLDARWLPVDEAIAKLMELPWPMMREPIIAHLRGEAAPGSYWLYRYEADGQATLIERVPHAWDEDKSD